MLFVDNCLYISSSEIPFIACKFESITRIIHSGALTTLGGAFSFELKMSISHSKRETKFFETTHARMKRCEKMDQEEDQKVLQELKQTLALNSSLITYSTILDGKEQHTLADIVDTFTESKYTVVISVPESYSREVYQEYAAVAIPFKEKLLCRHIELLKKIYPMKPRVDVISDINVIPHNIKRAFEVDAKEVTNDIYLGDGVYDSHTFTGVGMRPLQNIYECYGFALALLETYRPFWQKRNKEDEKILSKTRPVISVGPRSIRVCIVTTLTEDNLLTYKDW